MSSKQHRHSVLSVTEQKIAPQVASFTSKSTTVNAGSTAVAELTPAAEISPVCIEPNDVENANVLSSLLPGKKQRAPSLPARGGGNLAEKNTVCYLAVCLFISTTIN